MPNVVRVADWRADDGARTSTADSVLKIECEIDDMNPQWFAPATDRLFDAGALDVFLTPVLMKKGRPGTLVTVLAPEDRRQAVIDVLFRETTTIGVRVESVARETLDRRWVEVATSGGTVRIKVAERAGVVLERRARVRGLPAHRRSDRPAAQGRAVRGFRGLATQTWFVGVRAARSCRLRYDRTSNVRTSDWRRLFCPVSRFFLTTAIDYVNSRPHLGTAYEKIAADVIARYKRLAGFDVRFVMGNDEHSQNVFRQAARPVSTRSCTATGWRRSFATVWRSLNISFDDFIRTTEPRHARAVQKMAHAVCIEAGDIYEGEYEGWYCVSCEAFKQEKDLVDGLLSLHPPDEPEWIKERNYFFRLSEYRRPLLATTTRAIPTSSSRSRAATRCFGSSRAASRTSRSAAPGRRGAFRCRSTRRASCTSGSTRSSTTPPPSDYGTDQTLFEQWWPADLHVIGKDITRFHCGHLAGDAHERRACRSPAQVFGHGWS